MTNDEIIAKFYEAVQSGDYQSFLDTVLHTQYIGARYVPLFADPLQWSNANTYEPLTIVTDQGNSYTSRQYVPTGIDIANTDYWALTGNYNAQIEQYRQEVQGFNDRITQAENNSNAALKPKSLTNAREIVVIGDSFSDPTYRADVWPVVLEQDYGYTVHNYAVRGAGFVTKSGIRSATVLSQAQEAAADETFDKSKIQDVIIYAGYNDFMNQSQDPTTAANNARSAVEALVSAFPNATIRIFTITMGQYSGINLDKWQNILQFQNLLMQIPNCITHDATCWLFRLPRQLDVCESDKEFIHPNTNGHILLAKWINQGYADPYSFTVDNSSIFSETLNATNATINSFNKNENAKIYGNIDEYGQGKLIFDSIGSCNVTFNTTNTIALTNTWLNAAAAYFNPAEQSGVNLAAAVTNFAQISNVFIGTTGLILYVSPQTAAAQTLYFPKIYLDVNMRNHALTQLR